MKKKLRKVKQKKSKKKSENLFKKNKMKIVNIFQTNFECFGIGFWLCSKLAKPAKPLEFFRLYFVWLDFLNFSMWCFSVFSFNSKREQCVYNCGTHIIIIIVHVRLFAFNLSCFIIFCFFLTQNRTAPNEYCKLDTTTAKQSSNRRKYVHDARNFSC